MVFINPVTHTDPCTHTRTHTRTHTHIQLCRLPVTSETHKCQIDTSAQVLYRGLVAALVWEPPSLNIFTY